MNRTSIFAVCAVLAAPLLGTTVQADPSKETTYLTFDSAVAIPGATLTPGTYIFERADTDNSLVRVLSRDRSHVYLTQFTKTIDRPASAPDGPAVTFDEPKSGLPVPVKAWFPEGEHTGQAFVYPRS